MDRTEELKLNDKVKFDNKGGAILGVLEGPVADFINPTRNDRGYSESLWDKKLFDDPIVNEMFENGGIPGELDHPTDRQEICSEKIAVIMPEKPTKDKSGVLMGKFNILDTPCGKIAYTLAKAGFKFGVSSRGTGEVYEDENGNEQVDEDSYEFTCFDLVLLPAVEKARMTLVTESLNDKKFNYKKELNESLEKASDEERKIMQETLDNLNIDYSSKKKKRDNKCDSKEVEQENGEAIDNGLKEVLENLQDALKIKSSLEAKVLDLQEKLAVSDTKVNNLREDVVRYKSTTASLSDSAKELKEFKQRCAVLEEQIKKDDKIISSQKARLKTLIESKTKAKENVNTNNNVLNESIVAKETTIKTLRENIKLLKEEKQTHSKEVNALKESLENLKADSKLKEKNYSEKLHKLNESKNSLKKFANETVSKYIDLKATMIGVSPNEIKNKLNENFTLDDIDNVCDDLQSYQLSMNNLPFTLGRKNVKMKVKESVNEGLTQTINSHNDDDDIDSSLVKLAGLS